MGDRDEVEEIRTELRQIRTEVQRLTVAVESYTAGQAQLCLAQRARVDGARETLYNRPAGLLCTVDALQARVDAMMWAVRILGAAAIASVAATAWRALTGK